MRQAYELLSREGLIHSQRGVGTRVAALPRQAGDIEDAINDVYASPEALAFQILEIRQGAQCRWTCWVPSDRAAEDNVCIRKLHTYSGEPFCQVEIYMPAEVYGGPCRRTSPASASCSPAVLDALGSRCKRVRQRTTVMPADFPVCELLNIPFASPVAQDGRGGSSMRRATCCTPASPGTAATASSPRWTSPCPP